MRQEPYWRLVQESALKLTRAGKTPFTRIDLLEGVREIVPNCNPDSVNPIIQGITDNLKGGAPGADGKNILHSVSRGKFVLRSKPGPAERSPSKVQADRRRAARRSGLPIAAADSAQLPQTEKELRDAVLRALQRHLNREDWAIEAEGPLTYRLPSGVVLRHASDILISDRCTGKHVSIEIKYKSAVTDQFKCRAYDSTHMKEQYGSSLLTIMLFAKADSGISIERARGICYAFDCFYGYPASEMLTTKVLKQLATVIERFLLP